MTLAQKRKKAQKSLSSIATPLLLQTWLNMVSAISTEFSEALEGIYCGREGRVHVPLNGEYSGVWLDFGWYTVQSNPKVEYAYVS